MIPLTGRIPSVHTLGSRLKPTELCDGNYHRNKTVQSRSNPPSKVITCKWCSHCAMILLLEMDVLDQNIGEMIESHYNSSKIGVPTVPCDYCS